VACVFEGLRREFRSLPPNTLRPENDLHKFLSTTDIRFTLQEPGLGLRDLASSASSSPAGCSEFR
jgi:hypothetical protein